MTAVCCIDSESFETALKESVTELLETFDGVDKLLNVEQNHRSITFCSAQVCSGGLTNWVRKIIIVPAYSRTVCAIESNGVH